MVIYDRGMYLLNRACALEKQCYGSFSSISGNDEFFHVIIALFLDALVYYVLYQYTNFIWQYYLF